MAETRQTSRSSLLHLHDNDKIGTAEDIDSIVSAHIPGQHLYPDLYDTVTSCMLHGPCGTLDPNCVRMDKGECTQKFPKDFSPHTIFSDNGYTLYRRRDDGRVFMKMGKPLESSTQSTVVAEIRLPRQHRNMRFREGSEIPL